MRAERLLRHQLGYEDLRVDGAAHADIALPLGRAAVIGRRRGQRDHGDLAFERIKESFQRFLPFAAQMMRLVETDRADPQLLYGICPLRRAVRVRLRSHVQRLIGDRADRGFFVKRFGEVILQRFALRQEQLAEALAPLPPYGDGGGEDQRRHTRAADELETQHGLSAARRGHDMDPPVREVLIGPVEDLLLITAEAAAEGDAGKDVFHAFSPFPYQSVFLMPSYHFPRRITRAGKRKAPSFRMALLLACAEPNGVSKEYLALSRPVDTDQTNRL